MKVEIDTRSIWVLLAIKALRPLFFILLAIGFWAVTTMEPAEGLTPEGQRAIGIFLLCLVLWVSNMVPLAITSLMAIVLVPLLGIMPRNATYALFGNEAIFFILGAFILAGAVMHSGLSNRIALVMMRRYGHSPRRLLISMFLLAAVLSFFMSEHAVAAMLLPIALDISKALGLKPGRSNYGKLIFFALAWGSVIGGVATFLGGARVPLALGILEENTDSTIGFLEYTVAVFPLVVVLLIVGYFVLTRIFPVDIPDVAKAMGVIEKRAKGLGKLRYSEYAVATVMLLTIVAWSTLGHIVGLASVSLIAVAVLFIFKLVKWKTIEEYVNWGIILMYGGAIILGSALDKSGAARWIVESAIGDWATTPWTVFAVFSFLAIALTESMSNAAVIAVLVPVSIEMSNNLGLDPALLTYAIAVPAGLAFMLPMSTPANAIAISSGYVTVKDMVKGGFVMFLTAWVVFNLMAYFYWPLIGLGGLGR